MDYFRYAGTKTSSKNLDFLPQNDQMWPKIGNFGHFGPGLAGSFVALLVGWLVVVVREMYLARYLLTLYSTMFHMHSIQFSYNNSNVVSFRTEP